MVDARTHATIDAVWRQESARVVATVARMVHDVGLAEELAQDALVTALERWPADGIPDNPGAWLTATAKRRAIDRLRHLQLQQRKHVEVAHALEELEQDNVLDETQADDDIGDDMLRLVFTACHPVLPVDQRVALTLKMLGGLSTGNIARAFLTTEPTVAQRIVRAKRALAADDVPYDVPRAEALPARLDAVLEVVYLVFNEGYAASAGEDHVRPALCGEALRLGRLLAGLMPRDGEVAGLLALMALQASRIPARLDGDGEPVLLDDQDRALWNRTLIAEGLQALARADLATETGPYALQAAIAACHARTVDGAATDWALIARLYAALATVQPSPVVELNRAVALSRAVGPAAGLAVLDDLADEPALRGYHLLPLVRGDLLARLSRHEEAHAAFMEAARLAGTERERTRLLARADHVLAAG